MFSDLIKKIRDEKGYTQREFVAKLQLASREFANVDHVTISRWERGVTAPNSAKAIRILRCFMLDIAPFIKSLEATASKQVEFFLFNRFERNLQKHIFAALEYDIPTKSTEIKHDNLFFQANDPILEKIKSFHKRWNKEDFMKMRPLDLFLYQEEGKLQGYRLVDLGNEDQMLGFSLGMLFKNEVLSEQITHNNANVDFSLASSYTEVSTFALYIISGNISSAFVFIYLWKTRIQYLISHSNITEIYCNVYHSTTLNYLEQLGFVVVATKNEIKMGEIKIGNRYYDGCIMKVDTSIFLTRKEVISLFNSNYPRDH
ncbi:helix-turn-helix domain-containing protein [Vibrio sp. 1S139]|uniref:helix-turn-helix domain-containing protein n=1 Tax=Vibrio sp. 1S139 TaxID=3230006 RepID=UPI00352DE850